MLAPTDGYNIGDIVPFKFNNNYIALSFFVSLLGNFLTVQLLYTRTTLKGWQQRAGLLGCSTVMALVGIWSMHFVGNYSIKMGDGRPTLQLAYSPAWTAASALLPICTLFLAFLVADRRFKGGWKSTNSHIAIAGIVTGGAICGMHYTGNIGISNYQLVMELGHVAGACLVAVVASVGALTALFKLQDLWASNLLYRFAGAVVLAGTVSAMHWVASLGTGYRLSKRLERGSNARDVLFNVAMALCAVTFGCSLFPAWWQIKQQRVLRDRARQVVLACVRFDPEGRVMVTQDGHLPCQKITNDRNRMAFEDDFDITHPAFQWIYRVSHNWSSIARFVPKMRRHLQEARFLPQGLRRSPSTISSSTIAEAPVESFDDYSLLFREGFCVAASDLAQDVKAEMIDLGCLYDRVMVTGTAMERVVQGRRSLLHLLGISRRTRGSDPEAQNPGLDLFGKGQLLILTRHCGRREATRHQADGFRFETIDKISDRMAQNMQVPTAYLSGHLHKLMQHVRGEMLPSPRGTLLGCFILRPGINKKTMDVAVGKDCLDRLPYVHLSPRTLDTAALAVIQQLDGCSVSQSQKLLDESPETEDESDETFAASLRHRIIQLIELVDEPFFYHAVFSARPIQVPIYDSASHLSGSCNLLAFHIIPDVHTSSLKASSSLMFMPLSFFICRQQSAKGAPHHANFERKVYHEFAAIFSSKDDRLGEPTPERLRSSSSEANLLDRPPSAWWKAKSPMGSVKEFHNRQSATPFPESGSELADVSRASTSQLPFGGVMVSKDVTVEAVAIQREDASRWINNSTSASGGTEDIDVPTYVDVLCAIAKERWLQNERASRRS